MKIALFTDTYEGELGGATVYIKTLDSYLRKNGYNVKVFTWNSKNLTKEDRKKCITFPSIDIIKGVKGKAGFSPFQLFKELKEFSPDVIHNHSQYTMGIHAINISKKLKIPLIQHYHSYIKDFLHYLPKVINAPLKKTNIVDNLSAYFFNKSDVVIAPSKAIEKYLCKIGVKSKIKVIPFGINLENFYLNKMHKKNKNVFTLIYCGRLSKEKSVNKIINSFAIFAKEKNVKCLIIGDGEEKKSLEKLVKKLNMQEKIIFRGWIKRKKIVNEYLKADLFITLSEMETFGITILEALACGLPVIGTRALAIPELVKDGSNGYLVCGDNTEEIVDKINFIYKNKKTRNEFSKNAVLFAKQFDENIVFKKLELIYKSFSLFLIFLCL